MASAPRSFRPPVRVTASLVAAVLVLAAGCVKHKPVVLKPRYETLPPKEVPEYLKNTIVERVDVNNAEALNVNDFGLVANLAGQTGDAVNAPMLVRDYVIKQMVKKGIGSSRTPGLEKLSPEEMLRDPRNAIVRVDGMVPPAARKGQRFDVAVSSLANNSTQSLRGGVLYRTELKMNGADPRFPGVAIDVHAAAQGPVFVNPGYAMSDPAADASARASLRNGVILDGGVVLQDRAIIMRVRAPQFATTRVIERRIDAYFHDESVAAAIDEGQVQMFMPPDFNGDWQHFVGVATHLFFDDRPEFSVAKARQLAEEAQKPGAFLEDISYCWEGLGAHALPHIIPLMNHQLPEVAFAATRAAAHLQESSALTVLVDMARTSEHPFQLEAVQILGSLPTSPVISQMLRTLLDSSEATVRIEAYRLLAEKGDSSIYTQWVGPPERRFALDIIPSTGAPLIYASRRGTPRIAIFGTKPALNLPISFATMGNRLTITADPGERLVKIFFRDPSVLRPQPVLSNPDIAELIARLGGQGAETSPQKLDFSYSDVVAIVQAMTQDQRVMALAGGNTGQRVPAPFVLQALPRVQDEINSAPAIPEHGRPQGDGDGADAATTMPTAIDDSRTSRAEARK